MHYLAFLLIIGMSLTACQNNSKEQTNKEEDDNKASDSVAMKKEKDQYDTVHYGKKIKEKGALSLASALDSMGDKEEYHAKVKGKVTSVCQKKGCWMKLERPDGQSMRVTFKDYGFFVPKDLAGEKVVMQGKAYTDTLSVKHRKHFARDAGKSEKEVEEITEPKMQVAFKAEGVKILQ